MGLAIDAHRSAPGMGTMGFPRRADSATSPHLPSGHRTRLREGGSAACGAATRPRRALPPRGHSRRVRRDGTSTPLDRLLDPASTRGRGYRTTAIGDPIGLVASCDGTSHAAAPSGWVGWRGEASNVDLGGRMPPRFTGLYELLR